MIKKLLDTKVVNGIDFNKAIIITGARQVAKTTLINKILDDKSSVLWIDADIRKPEIISRLLEALPHFFIAKRPPPFEIF